MKPLSIIYSLKSNVRKYLNQISAIVLGVFILYFFCVMGGGIEYGIKTAMYKPYEKMSFLQVNDNPSVMSKYEKELKSNENVERVIPSKYGSMMIDGLIGGLDIPFITLDSVDMKYMTGKLGYKIVKGTLPQNDNELLIDTLTAAQFHLNIGDYYGTKVNENHRIEGKYKVAGIYEGNESIVFCSNSTVKASKNADLAIIPKAEGLNKVNNYLNDIKDDQIEKITLEKIKSSTESAFQTLKIAALVIMIILALVVTIIISNISYVNFSDRMGELSILYSIGHSKGFLRKRLLSEMCIVLSIGGILGILLALAGSYAFKTLYCDPKGLLIEVMNWWYVLITAGLIILVITLMALPIRRFVGKMNMAEVLEGNY